MAEGIGMRGHDIKIIRGIRKEAIEY